MRSSSSKATDQTRGAHRAKKTRRVNVEQVSTMKLKFKLYQVFLFFITVSMVYYWHRSFMVPMEDTDASKLETVDSQASGYVNYTLNKIAKHAVVYFLMFMTEPFNLTLIMVCFFSRIVLNFITFHFTFTLSEIVCRYEIDESYFIPIIQTTPAVDV